MADLIVPDSSNNSDSNSYAFSLTEPTTLYFCFHAVPKKCSIQLNF